MRGILRTSVLATAAVTAAVALYVGLTLPRPSLVLAGPKIPTQVSGAYHIHSTRSDGSGTIDEIAEAARRAGLSFIIVTDHGDATRVPDPPEYRHGVLCIDAVEISSADGHIVALGLTQAAPYPIAGPGRDVIEDIHRFGGAAIVAHPDSPNPDLRWRGQNLPFDGIEWLNVDSEWRDTPGRELVATAVRGLLRPAETIATLFSRPVRTLQRWDATARVRPLFGIAAVDAHARIGWREDEEPRQRTALRRPTYEALFRTVVQTVVLEAPLTGTASVDGPNIVAAVTAGHSFSVVRAFGFPVNLEFSARGSQASAVMGGRVMSDQTPVTFRASALNAPGARLSLLRNGQAIASNAGEITHLDSAAGTYRVEVAFPGASVPWVVSNPIGIIRADPVLPDPASSARGRGEPSAPSPLQSLSLEQLRWASEHDASSQGTVRMDAGTLRFEFNLGSGEPHGQYAALVTALNAQAGIDRVEFVGRANQPMRMSVQVRIPGGRDGERWRRSVYLDGTPRRVSLRLEDFEPAGAPTSRRPVAVPLHALLFVIDTVNTRPGSSGTVELSELALGISRPPP